MPISTESNRGEQGRTEYLEGDPASDTEVAISHKHVRDQAGAQFNFWSRVNECENWLGRLNRH
jgi:hypothetical protein